MKDESTPNPPIDKIRVGSVAANIWRNTTAKGIFYSVSFERRYRDQSGDWKDTDSYSSRDLLALAKAADLAHTKILDLRGQPEDDEETLLDRL